MARMFSQLPPGLVEAIGFLAGTLTTISFIPQVIKTWRTRSTGDLSGAMLGVFTAGVISWLVYGLALWSWPVIGANAVTLLLTGALLVMKVRGPRA